MSNGICWSPDDKQMYFIDSLKKEIYSFDYDIQTGNICKSIQILRQVNLIFSF